MNEGDNAEEDFEEQEEDPVEHDNTDVGHKWWIHPE